MLPLDEMQVAIAAARDQVLAVVTRHERDAHGGSPCIGNRASAVAYLAHCLGVRGQAWLYAESLLAEYDAFCPGRDCTHGN